MWRKGDRDAGPQRFFDEPQVTSSLCYTNRADLRLISCVCTPIWVRSLVVDHRKAPTNQVGEALSRGLELLARTPPPNPPVHRRPSPAPGAIGPGRIAGEFLVRHVRVDFKGARRFHEVDPASTLADPEFSGPRCRIHGYRDVDVVRRPAPTAVRTFPTRSPCSPPTGSYRKGWRDRARELYPCLRHGQ